MLAVDAPFEFDRQAILGRECNVDQTNVVSFNQARKCFLTVTTPGQMNKVHDVQFRYFVNAVALGVEPSPVHVRQSTFRRYALDQITALIKKIMGIS